MGFLPFKFWFETKGLISHCQVRLYKARPCSFQPVELFLVPIRWGSFFDKGSIGKIWIRGGKIFQYKGRIDSFMDLGFRWLIWSYIALI